MKENLVLEIGNWKLEIPAYRRVGFTLIEVVIGITILGVIGLVMAEVLSRTFRGGDKTQLVTNIKQNGQAALSVMDQTIRYSKLICISPDVVTVLRDEKLVRYRFTAETATVNGSIVQEEPPITEAETNLANLCLSSTTYSTPPPKNLLNTNSTSFNAVSVKPGAPFFEDVSQGTGKGTIQIRFNLGVSVTAGTSVHETLGAPVPFNTTIQIR